MKTFKIIATINRGAVNPPEPLDERGQYVANLQFEIDEEKDRQARARLRQHRLVGLDPLRRRQA